ncbi:MAG: amino acid adenylation domain-containing protein, partial [Minicystis sp.]
MSQKNIENIYSLSPLQQGILFHAVFDSGSGAYFMHYGWTLSGVIDLSAFARAWEAVVARHPILRTAFVWERVEKPVQVVWKQVPIKIDQVDLRGVPATEQQARLAALAEEDRRRGFDLSRAPLMRFTLIRLRDDASRFLWSSHHLLSDGWSISIVFQEVLAFYEAFSQKREIVLDRPRPYGEFIAWLQKQDRAKTEAFFREQLRGFSAPTPLVVDHAPPPSPLHPAFDSRRMELSPSAAAALAAFGPEHQLTMNTLVQGAWALLLSRYAGQDDVLYGSIVSGRSAPLQGIEKMVGVFINTVPVRVCVEQDKPIVVWLAQLQKQQAEIREHEHAPLFEVQALSEVPKGTPLFESLLVFENYPVAEAIRKPGAARELSVGEGKATIWTNYPLSVVAAFRGSLTLRIDYDRNRFEDATIDRMLSHLATLLEGIARSPSAKVESLSILGEAERRTVLEAWNDTQVAYPPETLIHQLFEAQVDRTPDATAVRAGGRELSYRQLDEQANRLAHRLMALGVGPDVLVGVCLGRTAEMVVALLGVLKAGGAYVTLDPSYPRERLAFMIEDTAVPVVITAEAQIALLPGGAPHLLAIDTLDLEVESAHRPQGAARAENLAYVIYTSGSTGKPKGAMLEHRGVVNYLRWAVDAYRVGEGSGAPVHSSIAFDLTITSLFTPLLSGQAVTLLPEDPGVFALADALRRGPGFSLVKLTPSHLEALSGELAPGEVAGSTRALIIGGEALFARHLQLFRDHAPATRLINEYGPTETVVGCATYEVPEGPLLEGAILIGRPIANTRIYVLDRWQRPAPIGVTGEIYIAGAQVGRGYLNRPELTTERFLPDPFVPSGRMYRSGDLGRRRADGELEYLGRIDQQVKVRGHRIELGEIEAVLSGHPSVREVAVLLREDEPGDLRLVAYFTSTEGVE